MKDRFFMLYTKYILLQVLSGSMFLCSANLKSLFAIELLLNKKSSYYPKNFTNDSVCAVCQKKILFKKSFNFA